MELLPILDVLWSRRWLVALGAVLAIAVAVAMDYRVSLGAPPQVHSKQYKVGLAAADVLIDTPTSSVAALDPTGSGQLVYRAQLLANLMATAPVELRIARDAGVPPEQLITNAPASGGLPLVPNPLATAAAALKPSNTYSLTVVAQQKLPIIALSTQAPDAASAARLANSAVKALGDYLNTIAAQEGIPASSRPVVTSLGAAQSGEALRGPGRIKGLVVGFVVFVLFCSAIVVITGLSRRWGAMQAQQRAAASEEPSYSMPLYDGMAETVNGEAALEPEAFAASTVQGRAPHDD
jgi:hypothetical protein